MQQRGKRTGREKKRKERQSDLLTKNSLMSSFTVCGMLAQEEGERGSCNRKNVLVAERVKYYRDMKSKCNQFDSCIMRLGFLVNLQNYLKVKAWEPDLQPNLKLYGSFVGQVNYRMYIKVVIIVVFFCSTIDKIQHQLENTSAKNKPSWVNGVKTEEKGFTACYEISQDEKQTVHNGTNRLNQTLRCIVVFDFLRDGSIILLP